MRNIYFTYRRSVPLVGSGTFMSLLLALTFVFSFSIAEAQWLDWANETSTRLTLTTVANSDDEEKDMWAADLNNDGDEDLIVVRKEPFSTSSEPGKTNLLLMNVNGILTDQTLQYAPEFISTVNFSRDVYVGDFDGDNWKDVITANTFGQQPKYFRNRGNDGQGNWLGLINESASRFPLLNDDTPLFCAVWGGDVNGDNAPDIYFVNYKSSGTAKDYLLINNGSGVFTNESQARLGNLRNSAFGTAVQIVDMDNDGDNDIVKTSTLFNVSPWNALGVFVLFNNGTGTFTNWQNITPGGAPYMFEVADFNLDGKKDVYVVDDGTDYLVKVTGYNPNVSLTIVKTNLNYSSSNGFGGNVHAADLDLDGDLDIGIADVDVDIPPCNSSRRMAIYRNDNGVFTDVYGSSFQGWADNNYDFAWLDINGDGLKDFVTGFCAGYGVFMNDNCDLAPTPSDYDLDGLADACDPCPTNPDPNCAPPTDYPTVSTDYNIARQWNEMLLASIRKDFARPTVHARNLFHISAAMWDAWSAYDAGSEEFLLGKTVDGFTCVYAGIPVSPDIESDREKAISYAAYRLLKHRFAGSPQAPLLNIGYDAHMATLGYDINYVSTDYSSGNAAALGNYIAQCYINFGLQDGSNEQNAYANTSYAPVNPPMNVDVPGNPNLVDFNRWQPLTLDLFIDQSGNPIPGATPPFLSPEWGKVTPFSLSEDDLTIHQRNGFDYLVYHDAGTPPLLQMDGSGTSEDYKWGFALVSIWSAHLTPDDGVMWDISPATQGNRDVLPTNFADYPDFYNLLDGGTDNIGYTVNPKTNQPYAPNLVPRGDYSRVLAEFWADGPDSETPPGHWFTLFNYVTDHPQSTRKYRGMGDPLDPLEWDVKGYLALGGAMHDVAVSIWGTKGWYDYIRPVSAIRGMAELGQSSDMGALSYHPAGLPLIPGYIELVLAGDPLANGIENIGKIKLKAWRGHDFIDNVDTEHAGVDWILAQDWLPYQRPSFVTPPFAGYISGHSTYSRAAAEILTDITGDEYFPGGLGVFTAEQNEFLVFEEGPSVDIQLQWATYQDAADESSMSRIWGGIHPPCDDIPGRILAVEIAEEAFTKAESYFFPCVSAPAKPGTITTNGGKKVCPGEIKTYTIDAVPGSTHYNWIAPTGATITAGQGSLTATVSYGAGFTAVDTIKVAAVNNCGTSVFKTLKITPNTPAMPSLIAGDINGVCELTNVPYSVNQVAGITYNWTVPSGAIIGNGQGTNIIGVDFSNSVNSGKVAVTASNGCGISAPRSKTVKATPETPVSISGSTVVCANQAGIAYSTSAVPTATAYEWRAPVGSTISDGVNTSINNVFTTSSTSVTVNYAATEGKLKVKAINDCGSGSFKSVNITFNCRAEHESLVSNQQPEISVYPNPTSNVVNVMGIGLNNGACTVILSNLLGQQIMEQQLSTATGLIETQFNLVDLPDGMYYITLHSESMQQTFKVQKHQSK